jgi:hypothetical protein
MKIDGLPVVDAKRPIAVKVTVGDIRKSKPKKWESCAVAVACRRQLSTPEAVVHLSRTYIRKGNKWERYFTPLVVREAIQEFDRGGKFELGEYVLLPLPKSLRIGAHHELYYKQPVKNPHNNKRRRAVDVRNHQGWDRRVQRG